MCHWDLGFHPFGQDIWVSSAVALHHCLRLPQEVAHGDVSNRSVMSGSDRGSLFKNLQERRPTGKNMVPCGWKPWDFLKVQLKLLLLPLIARLPGVWSEDARTPMGCLMWHLSQRHEPPCARLDHWTSMFLIDMPVVYSGLCCCCTFLVIWGQWWRDGSWKERNLLADGSRHIQLEETAVCNGRPLQVIAMKTY